jgi:hypothetical protein
VKIVLHNMKARVCVVSGPVVRFDLSDHSQAHVLMDLRLADPDFVVGYPAGSGLMATASIKLLPGDYVGRLTMSAIPVGALGPNYQCSVSINGVLVASASGALPNMNKGETSARFFVLRIV